MQTFLPHPDFHQALSCLDSKRLGNQVYREGITLLRGGWQNHPAAKMWRGYRSALVQYIWIGLDVLEERGLRYEKCRNEIRELYYRRVIMPHWLGDETFHASHRSNLLRKDPLWYGQFGWTEPPNLPYVWPVN